METKPSTPRFVLEQSKLQANLAHFEALAKETNIVWLYTLKAFDKAQGLDIIAQSFSGFSLGNHNEYLKVEAYANAHIHSYAPAYYPQEVQTLAKASLSMSFNSLNQWQAYSATCAKETSLGLRINPKLSLNQPEYCDSNNARLGVGYQDFLSQYQENPEVFTALEGLHFHALCHQGVDALVKLIGHIRQAYPQILSRLKWLNLGGGQNFTQADYDSKAFVSLMHDFAAQYPHLTLYFEPGSALVYNTGYFECTILDILPTPVPTIIVDTSIETHLLDIAITKQRPKVRNSTMLETPYRYQITGMSCIAGDEMGTFNFEEALKIGDKIVFENMIGYTLVKQTQFNGIKEAAFVVVP